MAEIATATMDDAPVLAALGRDTFIETFGHLYPAEDLAEFLAAIYVPATFAGFLADPAQRLWIAREGNLTVGYAHAGPCALPHPEVTPACGELKRLYVRKGLQKAGLGSALLREALTWLQTPGRTVWIGVWSENFGAQRLYARHGFSKVGEYEFPVGSTRDREFILRR